MTALETDGSEMPAAELADATITDSRRTTFTSDGMGDAYAGTIEIVRGKKPKAFDLVFTSGPPEGMRNRGIYTLDGDTWTICLATRGDARPRRFRDARRYGLCARDAGARVARRERRIAERANAPRDRQTAPLNADPSLRSG